MLPRSKLKKSKKPFEIDENMYMRFPVAKQAFVTVSFQDTGEIGYNLFMEKMMQNMIKRMMHGEEGRLQQHNALDLGANTLNLLLGQYGFPNFQFLKWAPLFVPEVLASRPVDIPEQQLTEMVKHAAGLYGSDLVGVADLDPKWIYSKDLFKPFVLTEGDKAEETEEAFLIPTKINKAIVMAVAMDDEMIETSPLVDASTATSLGYSRMGMAAVSLAEYIRALGYQAIPCMNDTALSIPLAIEAGLGELGRHGLLITPEFGSNIRLCKVLTDMPLIKDEPIDLGIAEFCENCHLCAEHCPSQSISYEKQSFEGVCANNNPGVKKWYIYGENCLRFWQENGASCANCIAVCPFTRGFESMQCVECVKCETKTGCALHVNTHLREKFGYLEVTNWGEKPKVLKPRRRGL